MNRYETDTTDIWQVLSVNSARELLTYHVYKHVVYDVYIRIYIYVYIRIYTYIYDIH